MLVELESIRVPCGDRWFLDEVVVSIQGKRRYLWRAVDQDGDLIEILVQKRKDTQAAGRNLGQPSKRRSGDPIKFVQNRN